LCLRIPSPHAVDQLAVSNEVLLEVRVVCGLFVYYAAEQFGIPFGFCYAVVSSYEHLLVDVFSLGTLLALQGLRHGVTSLSLSLSLYMREPIERGVRYNMMYNPALVRALSILSAASFIEVFAGISSPVTRDRTSDSICFFNRLHAFRDPAACHQRTLCRHENSI